MAIKIQRKIPQLVDVYYDNQLIGTLINNLEFLQFRINIIDEEDFDKYHLRFSPQNRNWINVPKEYRDRNYHFDKYGICEVEIFYQEDSLLLFEIVQKQSQKRIIRN